VVARARINVAFGAAMTEIAREPWWFLNTVPR
jgi:hypothetical protein